MFHLLSHNHEQVWTSLHHRDEYSSFQNKSSFPKVWQWLILLRPGSRLSATQSLGTFKLFTRFLVMCHKCLRARRLMVSGMTKLGHPFSTTPSLVYAWAMNKFSIRKLLKHCFQPDRDCWWWPAEKCHDGPSKWFHTWGNTNLLTNRKCKWKHLDQEYCVYAFYNASSNHQGYLLFTCFCLQFGRRVG